MTPQLQEAIQEAVSEIATNLAEKIVGILNDLPLSALTGIGGSTTAVAKTRAPRAPKADKATADGRRPKRTEDEMQGIIDMILSALKAAGEPLRSEQLQEKLALDKFDIQRPLVLALQRKLVSKTGQKRSTAYSLKSSKVTAAPKPKAAVKKPAAKARAVVKTAAATKKTTAKRKPAKRREAHVEVASHNAKNSAPDSEATPA